jgi:hypothetical protein
MCLSVPELSQLYSSLKDHVNGLLKLNYLSPKQQLHFGHNDAPETVTLLEHVRYTNWDLKLTVVLFISLEKQYKVTTSFTIYAINFKFLLTEKAHRFYWQRNTHAWPIKFWVSVDCFIMPDSCRDAIKARLNIKHCKINSSVFLLSHKPRSLLISNPDAMKITAY